jgi:hypothetical protein
MEEYTAKAVDTVLFRKLNYAVDSLEKAISNQLPLETIRECQMNVSEYFSKFVDARNNCVDSVVPWETLYKEGNIWGNSRYYRVILNETDESLINRALKAQDDYFLIVLGARVD